MDPQDLGDAVNDVYQWIAQDRGYAHEKQDGLGATIYRLTKPDFPFNLSLEFRPEEKDYLAVVDIEYEKITSIASLVNAATFARNMDFFLKSQGYEGHEDADSECLSLFYWIPSEVESPDLVDQFLATLNDYIEIMRQEPTPTS